MASTQMFSFSFSPEMRKFSIAFEDWAKELKDWRRAWKDVHRLFQSHERQHLDSEGKTTGRVFAPLLGGKGGWRGQSRKVPYAEWKAENFPGLPIMQRDGVLYSALVEGGRGSLFKRNRMSMEAGIKKNASVSSSTAGEYNLYRMATAHQTGKGKAYAGKNKTPRPPVRYGSNASDRGSFAYAISQVMQAHIVLARRRALQPEIEKAFGKAHAESSGAAKSTIEKMIRGTWK